MQNSSKIWRRTEDAAKRVGLTAATFAKYRVTGGGPPYRKAGERVIVYSDDEVDAWLTPCANTSNAAA